MEEDLWCKTTCGGRRHLVEDDLWWKTTCGGRQPVVEDDLQRKTTFAGSLHAAYSALRHFLFCFETLSLENILQSKEFVLQIFGQQIYLAQIHVGEKSL